MKRKLIFLGWFRLCRDDKNGTKHRTWLGYSGGTAVIIQKDIGYRLDDYTYFYREGYILWHKIKLLTFKEVEEEYGYPDELPGDEERRMEI